MFQIEMLKVMANNGALDTNDAGMHDFTRNLIQGLMDDAGSSEYKPKLEIEQNPDEGLDKDDPDPRNDD